MITYISAFIFYTLAMTGILLVAFIVFKKMQIHSPQNQNGIIKIIDSIPIAPKKNLIVVKVKDEKFLIASGNEHTTFLSKLDTNENVKIDLQEDEKRENIQNYIEKRGLSNLKPKKILQYEDNIKSNEEKLQRQFRELMGRSDEEKNSSLNRKEMIRELLNDLTLENTKSRSKY